MTASVSVDPSGLITASITVAEDRRSTVYRRTRTRALFSRQLPLPHRGVAPDATEARELEREDPRFEAHRIPLRPGSFRADEEERLAAGNGDPPADDIPC